MTSAAVSVSIIPNSLPSCQCSFGLKEKSGTSPCLEITVFADSSGPTGVLADGIFGTEGLGEARDDVSSTGFVDFPPALLGPADPHDLL